MGFFENILGNSSERQIKKIMPLVNKINGLEESIKKLTDAQLRAKTDEFKSRLANGETLDDLLPEAFAVVREAAVRTVGMRHFDVQLIGGIVLHQGKIAEMKTGEGKTLVATLPSYLNALEGKGVHVVTVNDYLAKRDSQWMGKIHKFLGLSVGCIVHELENDERRDAYNCDITYGTNNEFGFDYLRDNMVVYKEQLVQRPLHYGIVDEVDSILIDEARTPLIISGMGEKSTDMYEQADKFVKTLERGADIEKKSKSELLAGLDQEESGDYMVDIKSRTVQLTAQGIAKAERYFGIEDIADIENTELNHHIIQALRANAVFQRDVDYVVQDGEILIVDEFTGRLMVGRRYSEGLHQALEAKEHVNIQNENKTLATITFQNYFRMFHKLGGMTGTAKTEEEEFQGIYGLDVVEIPTNRPVQRVDYPDEICGNEKVKFEKVVDEIEEVHKTGQPILVGTISVEKSEMLSAMLKRRGIKHEVLNAKLHAKEAEIVAQAGKFGCVTIATNMAGRGTDILLGGNPEFLARRELRQQGLSDELIEEATGHSETDDIEILDARKLYKEAYEKHKKVTDKEHEEVVKVGGLHIIGTERHESRRIDNQLRGRAGRQGDPGSTRFYVAFTDDLMVRFGGERITAIMDRLDQGEATFNNKIFSRQIETAQKRVESYNYEIRKNVLQYDDVMNRHRNLIYGQRHSVLMGEDITDSIKTMVEESVKQNLDMYCAEGTKSDTWDVGGIVNAIMELAGIDISKVFDGDKLNRKNVENDIMKLMNEAYQRKEDEMTEQGIDMREVERVCLLKSVDFYWMNHIDDMTQLKQGIGLQSIGQKDPVRAYTAEGFKMFDEMIDNIRENTVRTIYHVTARKNVTVRQQVAKPIEPAGGDGKPQPKKVAKEPGRNDPCPCGSGKKYKNCCGADKKN